MKLTVFDSGDMSVGIFPSSWTIECPFEKESTSEDELTYFKQKINGLYDEYIEGRLSAMYDFEIEAENKLIQEEEKNELYFLIT